MAALKKMVSVVKCMRTGYEVITRAALKTAVGLSLHLLSTLPIRNKFSVRAFSSTSFC